MTRLRTEDIDHVGSALQEQDSYLESLTGLTLEGLARHAAGLARGVNFRNNSFCVVPLSAGEGIIPGFSEAVCEILRHIGFSAEVAPFPDQAGLTYVRGQGNKVLMWADDRRFVAELPGGRLIDNTEATARGYVAGLELMADGISGRRILLPGCGRLGRAAALLLAGRGAVVTVFDPDAGRMRELAAETAAAMADSLDSALAAHDLIFLAANAGGVVHSRHVTQAMYIAAPGMPCGVTPAALQLLEGRLLHDPLQIGVATMAFMAFV